MKTSADINWIGNMAFEFEADGHKLIFDADPAVGGEGKGPTPKPFMLYSLIGCTGMDVVSILKKMRVDLKEFNVKVETE
ncbi:MAG: OsmC family protein, partial [Bacteroidota bacterium]|nr:OsmC family protein [Bacteroidota bacterium]